MLFWRKSKPLEKRLPGSVNESMPIQDKSVNTEQGLNSRPGLSVFVSIFVCVFQAVLFKGISKYTNFVFVSVSMLPC